MLIIVLINIVTEIPSGLFQSIPWRAFSLVLIRRIIGERIDFLEEFLGGSWGPRLRCVGVVRSNFANVPGG